MLNKLGRFRGRNSLNSVYKHGQTVNKDQLSLKYLKTRPEKNARIAVVVSRKVSKKAVVRNRIRRRIYEQMRLKTSDNRLNADVVLVVYNESYATMDQTSLSKILDDLLNKSQVIEKK